MQLKLLILCILFIKNIGGKIGDKCKPNDDISEGSCKLLIECEVGIRDIKKLGHHTFARCGFKDFLEIVCCPNGSEVNKADDDIPRSKKIADRECQKIMDSSIPPLNPYVIGGSMAGEGEFPHMVALGYEERDTSYNFLCGGSLISKSYVLTAAHCRNILEPAIVRMGVTDISGKKFNETTDEYIAEIITHPNYTRGEAYNDIALIRLRKPAELSLTVNPICLYTLDNEPNVTATVIGWGITSRTSETPSNILLKAPVQVVASDKCKEMYPPVRKLPNGLNEGQMCAGDPNGLRDTCQGDSGGPLQIPTAAGFDQLVGLTSYGRDCATKIPAVYTRVSHYLDWIQSVVWPQ